MIQYVFHAHHKVPLVKWFLLILKQHYFKIYISYNVYSPISNRWVAYSQNTYFVEHINLPVILHELHVQVHWHFFMQSLGTGSCGVFLASDQEGHKSRYRRKQTWELCLNQKQLRKEIQEVHQNKSVKDKKPECDLGLWEWSKGSKQEAEAPERDCWLKLVGLQRTSELNAWVLSFCFVFISVHVS